MNIQEPDEKTCEWSNGSHCVSWWAQRPQKGRRATGTVPRTGEGAGHFSTKPKTPSVALNVTSPKQHQHHPQELISFTSFKSKVPKRKPELQQLPITDMHQVPSLICLLNEVGLNAVSLLYLKIKKQTNLQVLLIYFSSDHMPVMTWKGMKSYLDVWVHNKWVG